VSAKQLVEKLKLETILAHLSAARRRQLLRMLEETETQS
jgi:hypothetical protein